ncbi:MULTISPECIES: efflux RND transporter periplasmic adaptor subunit [Bacillus]|uniref:Hemolysin D n=2 Tax=Bacillus TaxID=1386 RepID=A0A0M4FSB3_9BACI|nr:MULTISPECIES: efflux RND transporter periplasmic adaptor subunit [Bacillus]ALC82409.1 hemolysin D [Bacillus gobiensis]MBP1081289.1 HlyD family secretion protein [Bacillus capparidis]MED1095968.1 efflux RND transporter periplasmic adaptor subunit [Bacillus capparidis]
MKKLWIGIGIVVIIAIFIGVNVFRTVQTSGTSREVQVVSLEEKEISSTVMVPGTLGFSQEQNVFYEADKGEVQQILVKEGDAVKKGTPLLRYTNEQLELEKEQNALTIESKELQIDQFEQKREDLEQKEKDLTKQLGEKEAKSQIDPEREQLDMDEKLADLEIRQNMIQKETIEKQLDALVVKSEADGTVISVDKEAASKKTEIQEPIIHIGNTKNLIVEGVLSEYDTLKVKKEQPVKLTSDVIQGQEWKGKVTAVGLVPNTQGNEGGAQAGGEQAVQYPLEVKFDGKLPNAKTGFKFIMEIETDKRKAATLPAEAIKKDGDQSYVFIVEDGKAKRVDIKVGESADESIEIIEGLSADNQVILSPAADLQSGTEVSI